MAKKRASRARPLRKAVACEWQGCSTIQSVRSNGMALKYCTEHNSMAAAEVWRQRKAGVEEGHRRLASNGYWQVMHQGYWKWEHHVIAEQWLGRPLTDGETVVHLGAADDNSIESLGLRIVIPLVECVTAGPVNANAPETL